MSKGNRNRRGMRDAKNSNEELLAVGSEDIHFRDPQLVLDRTNDIQEYSFYDNPSDIQEDVIFSEERKRYLTRKSRSSTIHT